MLPAGVPRKKDFKKGVDADDARRKREDNIIELRKNKRDENLQKKRLVHAGPSYDMQDSSARTQQGLPYKVRRAPLVQTYILVNGSLTSQVYAATGRASFHGGGSVQQQSSRPVRSNTEV